MYLRQPTPLQDLQSILYGYSVATEINGAPSMKIFNHLGPFSEWLWPRLGMQYPSALSWAAEIERAAQAAGASAVDMFFDLLDQFHAEPVR
ncbi:hypothetical protein [Streptomyces sp. IMTB 1903]|uniref:hypothetical protein n=1 Tax=Streptomyces sp. IMTB 1903 TaxID=1776680 RepID=UPI00099E53EB|nr:hypothetical protein [Streptomyces sp. IMTB 1903]